MTSPLERLASQYQADTGLDLPLWVFCVSQTATVDYVTMNGAQSAGLARKVSRVSWII